MSGKLKEVRERISSVKSTQQITKAMKMVSAAKLKKAQDAITEMRPYATKLDKMLINILSNLDGDANISFGKERDIKSRAVVVVSSSRGLCGAFNANVAKEALTFIESSPVNTMVYCIGKKGYEFIKRRVGDNVQFNLDHLSLLDKVNFEDVSSFAEYLMNSFSNETYDQIVVSYANFKNPAVQYPLNDQFLPVKKIEKAEDDQSKSDYIFEPNKETLLEQLVPSILATNLYKSILDTRASEHGARMTAMDKATENAQEMLKDLKITYNKARQETITKEILEIVGGAAALGN